MRRCAIILYCLEVVLVSTPVLAGCGSAPCVELSEKVCAATDDKACRLYSDSVGGESPSESQNRACELLLDDPQTLDGVLELLRKRSRR